jgi:hypothetical protein
VQQFLVEFIAVNGALAFMPPRANLEDSFPLRSSPVGRTTEESFRHKMIPARMRAASDRSCSIVAGAIKFAAAFTNTLTQVSWVVGRI